MNEDTEAALMRAGAQIERLQRENAELNAKCQATWHALRRLSFAALAEARYHALDSQLMVAINHAANVLHGSGQEATT